MSLVVLEHIARISQERERCTSQREWNVLIFPALIVTSCIERLVFCLNACRLVVVLILTIFTIKARTQTFDASHVYCRQV